MNRFIELTLASVYAEEVKRAYADHNYARAATLERAVMRFNSDAIDRYKDELYGH